METMSPLIGFGLTLLGGLIFFLLRTVFTLAMKKDDKNGAGCMNDAVKKAIFETHEIAKAMQEMHNVKDADGVPVWYTSKELREAVKSNAQAINKFADSIQVIANSVERQEKSTEKVIDLLLEERKNVNRNGN